VNPADYDNHDNHSASLVDPHKSGSDGGGHGESRDERPRVWTSFFQAIDSLLEES
jgi:hypothetical protein